MIQGNSFDDSDYSEFLMLRSQQARSSSIRFTPANSDIITRLMRRLLAELDHYYPIEKASLALYDPVDDRLCISHLHHDGAFKTGLALALPDGRSLMYQILQQGFPVADNYPGHITAGVVEKKILLGDQTKSVLLVPLVHDGDRLGVLSLASPKESAFSIYLDGVGESMIRRFAGDLSAVFAQAVSAG
jgi:transcriptional regulator with GAF, ATPase, and Fis domain